MRSNLRDRNDRPRIPSLEVDDLNATVLGPHLITRGIGETNVAVARTELLDATKVGRDRAAPVRAQRVDRVPNRPRASTRGVVDAAHVTPIFTVVPQHSARRTRDPLQHATLLPTPSRARADLVPAIVGAEVDESDLDLVIRPWRSVFKTDSHAEHAAPGRVELEFVVVAEPVVSRTARQLAAWRPGAGAS